MWKPLPSLNRLNGEETGSTPPARDGGGGGVICVIKAVLMGGARQWKVGRSQRRPVPVPLLVPRGDLGSSATKRISPPALVGKGASVRGEGVRMGTPAIAPWKAWINSVPPTMQIKAAWHLSGRGVVTQACLSLDVLSSGFLVCWLHRLSWTWRMSDPQGMTLGCQLLFSPVKTLVLKVL